MRLQNATVAVDGKSRDRTSLAEKSLVGGRSTAHPISFFYEGKVIKAFEGETIAAALAAQTGERSRVISAKEGMSAEIAKVPEARQAAETAEAAGIARAGVLEDPLYRHTRSGARRGLYCGMGSCYECLVTVDGRHAQRACMTKVSDGMQVFAQDSADAGGVGAQALAATPTRSAPQERSLDVLIVGAGPAGLSAACAARSRGVGVVVIDERSMAGGQFYKQVAVDHRDAASPATAYTDKQFEQGAALIRRARGLGVELIPEATVWATFGPHEIGVMVAGEAWIYRSKQLILAPGAYEYTAPFPGWTLPGVMTTGAAQTLVRSYRVAPGAPDKRLVIAGNGPLNLQLAVELLNGGANVSAVLESAPRPGLGQWRAALRALRNAPDLMTAGMRYLLQLRAAGVKVYWGAKVIRAVGEVGADSIERLKAIEFDVTNATAMRAATSMTTSMTASTATSATSATTLACDTLCIGDGFAPNTDIARTLGCEHDFVDRYVGHLSTRIDADGRTTVPGVFAVGDGTRIGGARVALARGTLAGYAAAEALLVQGAATDAPDAPEGRNAAHADNVVEGGNTADAANTESREARNAGRYQARQNLARAEQFQQALWTLFAASAPNLSALDGDTIICRCEEVTQRTLVEQIAEGHDTLAALKRNTRLGMGRCQGRNCAASAAKLTEEKTGRPREVMHFLAPRVPIRPVPLAALAFEKPEWGGHRKASTPNVARPVSASALGDQQTDVLVIGGGVMGACLAYFLSKGGRDVLVAERDDLNLQASGANAGSLHVQLLSFDFGSKARAGGTPAANTLALGPASVRLWQQLEAASGEDLEIRLTGGLMVADSAAGMAFLERKIALERSFGIEAALLDTKALLALSPHLSPTLLGAEFCPMEGKINPLRATYAVMRMASAQGARLQRATNVTAISRERDGFFVQTSRGRIRAKNVINAAGAWAKEIGAMVGVQVPVAGAPLQMIATAPGPKLVDHLIAHADRHLSLKQTATGGILIGGGWTAAFDSTRRMNHAMRESIEGNIWVANHVLPALKGMQMVRAWAGMNIDIDGAPILGPVASVPGFYNAVTSNGYTLSPIVAQSVANLIMGLPVAVDVAPFSIQRFDE